MVVGNALQMTLNGLRRNIAPLAIGLLALAVANPASANPTDCFTRTTVDGGKANDTANGSTEDPGMFGAPDVQAETGNHLFRIDRFVFSDEGECDGDDVDGLSVVLKNPFDIPGPDDLSGASFGALSSQMETDFPEFDHWTGWGNPDPNGEGGFPLSTAGFHGVSVCIFIGDDIGNASNLDDCVDGTADRRILSDINGQGMIFSIDLFDLLDIEGELDVCGDGCDGDEFELAVVVYTDLFHDTEDTFSHPEALIGYQFEHLVPEPSLLALLAPAAAGLAWRRRARR